MSGATDSATRAGRADVAVAAGLLVLGVLYGIQALREGLGSLGDTGAGFFPLIVAIVLVAASATVVAQERSVLTAPAAGVEDDQDDQDCEVDWLRIGAVLIASLAVPVVGNEAGFVVTLSAAVVVISKIMGLPGWRRPIILGIGFGAATWLVFIYWLFVPLPAGRLGLV